MKRLILHIGMHKTGTTSIQQILGNSRDILIKNDVYYPSIKPFNHSTSFPPILLNDPSKYEIFRQKGIYDLKNALIEQEKLKKSWIREFNNSKCNNFIISGEELTLIDESSVYNLKKLVDEFFDDVLVVLYVRHPNKFYPSVLSEYVKHGGENILHESYSRTFPLYKFRLEKYVNVFGKDKIKVRPFGREYFENGDLIKDFFNTCNISINTTLLNNTLANESLDENTVMFLLDYNRKYPRYKNGVINEKRGLPYRLHIFYSIINKVKDKKFTVEMKYNKQDSENINKEIQYINQFLDTNERFTEVISSEEPIHLPSSSDIPISYFIEVINEYNKEIDRLMTQIDGYISLKGKAELELKKLRDKVSNLLMK